MNNTQQLYPLTDLYTEQEEPTDINLVEKGFLIDEISVGTDSPMNIPFRTDAILVMIVVNGYANLSIDHDIHRLSENNILTIVSEHLIHFREKSQNFSAKLFLIEKEIFNFTSLNISPDIYLFLKKNPVQRFLRNEITTLTEIYDLMLKRTRQKEILIGSKSLYFLIFAFFSDLAGLVNKTGRNFHQPSFSHKENIYRNFFNLLREHVKENKNVSFYANQLCITSQYLSSVLKELSGLTANKWIDEMLLAEAKMQLHFTQNNIQQIANNLNFPDQSSFGKFFKKMTGKSPKAYRMERFS
ncbi:MAG: AraC family transcriptional regulator [Bacteroides sp.]|nr:AraC family transcriptional regulator [Bacteroides sp.]